MYNRINIYYVHIYISLYTRVKALLRQACNRHLNVSLYVHGHQWCVGSDDCKLCGSCRIADDLMCACNLQHPDSYAFSCAPDQWIACAEEYPLNSQVNEIETVCSRHLQCLSQIRILLKAVCDFVLSLNAGL